MRWERTLTTMAAILSLSVVPPIGAVVIAVGGMAKLRGMEDEGFPKMVMIPNLRTTVSLKSVPLYVLIHVPKALLEEGGDVVGHTLELLVAFRLGGLEPARNMSPHEGHGDGVGTGAMAAGRARLGLEGNGRQDGTWGEDEGAGRAATLVPRLGHGGEHTVCGGRDGGGGRWALTERRNCR